MTNYFKERKTRRHGGESIMRKRIWLRGEGCWFQGEKRVERRGTSVGRTQKKGGSGKKEGWGRKKVSEEGLKKGKLTEGSGRCPAGPTLRSGLSE